MAAQELTQGVSAAICEPERGRRWRPRSRCPRRKSARSERGPVLLNAPKTAPSSFYANLQTAEYPDGAVRGGLHKVTVAESDFRDALDNFQASVVEGGQTFERKPASAP